MIILVIVIILALTFDLINGFHDAANSIATIVSTKVLPPSMAVVWAAFFNFIAYLVFGLHVANTVGTGIIHPEVVTLPVLVATLVGAIIWNLFTWCVTWNIVPAGRTRGRSPANRIASQ
jgi:PiT family inorganic phosphate transporter